MKLRLAIWVGSMKDLNGTVLLCSGFWMDDHGLHVRTDEGVMDYALGTFDGVGVSDAPDL